MYKSSLCALAALLFIAANVTIIVLSWIIMARTISPAEPLVVTGPKFDESLREDWNKLPFVNVSVTIRNATVTSCPAGLEPLWSRTWPGLNEGCVIYSGTTNQTVVDLETAKTNNLTCDIPIPKQGPVLMDRLNATGYGFEFCGLRGGLPFMNVTRVDPKTMLCPNGTEPCSNYTSVENTICYPPDQHNSSCPLTDILISSNATEVSEMMASGLWLKKPNLIDRKWYTLYSYKVDKMPVTWTTLTDNPCSHANEVSIPSAASFYPLEAKPSNCTFDSLSNSTYDRRYEKNPYFSISEAKL